MPEQKELINSIIIIIMNYRPLWLTEINYNIEQLFELFARMSINMKIIGKYLLYMRPFWLKNI